MSDLQWEVTTRGRWGSRKGLHDYCLHITEDLWIQILQVSPRRWVWFVNYYDYEDTCWATSNDKEKSLNDAKQNSFTCAFEMVKELYEKMNGVNWRDIGEKNEGEI